MTINFRVFPATLINNQKIPLIKGWREAATENPAQINIWQELFRDRLNFFGIPCGAVNNIIVLDVDVKTNGFETLKNLNLQVPDTLSQSTLNGGKHFIFKFDPTRDPGNKVGFLPGLDIRSTGGWIAFWGKNYDSSKPILEAPQWLYDAAFAKQKIQITTQSSIKLAPEIAQKILHECLENVRNAPPGESNNVLNIESFKAAQLITSGSYPRQFIEEELFRAAKERGKPDYESRATITSGLDGGHKNSPTLPFTSEPPKLNHIAIPEPPSAPERWTPSYLTRTDLLNTSKLRKPQLFKDWSTEDISIITADGGTGKTTLKLFEAICLALGDRFIGFDCVQRGKTLFITGEDSVAKLGAILGAIMNQMGLFAPGEENAAKVQTVLNSVLIKKDADLCLISKDRQGFIFPNTSAMEKLMHAVDDIKPKMIVFDPIASFWGSESALNDMNKAVTKFMSELVDRSQASVEMINHMGKSSSAAKDMTQFAGRGGSGLPSNSRVSKVLRSLSAEEYQEMTNVELTGDDTAILCNVNKFSDGSILFNKPFVIKRFGYLFSRITLSPQKIRELEKQQSDEEKIFTFIKQCRDQNRYPSRDVVVGQFMNNGSPISKDRILRALKMLIFNGHLGEKVQEIDNPDLTKKEKALIIVDMEGKENGEKTSEASF